MENLGNLFICNLKYRRIVCAGDDWFLGLGTFKKFHFGTGEEQQSAVHSQQTKQRPHRRH